MTEQNVNVDSSIDVNNVDVDSNVEANVNANDDSDAPVAQLEARIEVCVCQFVVKWLCSTNHFETTLYMYIYKKGSWCDVCSKLRRSCRQPSRFCQRHVSRQCVDGGVRHLCASPLATGHRRWRPP